MVPGHGYLSSGTLLFSVQQQPATQGRLFLGTASLCLKRPVEIVYIAPVCREVRVKKTRLFFTVLHPTAI